MQHTKRALGGLLLSVNHTSKTQMVKHKSGRDPRLVFPSSHEHLIHAFAGSIRESCGQEEAQEQQKEDVTV